MIENGLQHTTSFHLAGIVPVAGQKLDFNFPKYNLKNRPSFHLVIININFNNINTNKDKILKFDVSTGETIWTETLNKSSIFNIVNDRIQVIDYKKGYDKFTQIAANLAQVAKMPKDMRDDLFIKFDNLQILGRIYNLDLLLILNLYNLFQCFLQ